MNLEVYLVQGMAPCIRLVLGPGPLDVVEVDQAYWEEHRQEFLDFCLGLPEVEGMNWRDLKEHADGNGLMAKLLIALGDLAGAWTMHPPLNAPWSSWGRDLPRILEGPTQTPRTVPKPSSGDLDGTECSCCGRPMGPADSLVHDLPASERDSELCLECEAMDCDADEGQCNVFPEKTAAERRRGLSTVKEPEEFEAAVPPGLAAYLKQFE